MINDFMKSLAQFSDPRFRRVVLIGVGGAILTILALWGAIGFTLNSVTLFSNGGWLETVADWLLGVGLALLVLLLFPAMTVLISSLLLDQVAEAVEDKHYPHLEQPRHQPFLEALINGLKFSLTALFLNILILPLLITGPIYVIAFYAMNGYLISREYFELVAGRRYDVQTMTAFRKRRQIKLWMAGIALTFLMTVPFVNLVAPVIATAFMVHYCIRLGAFQPGVAA
jgi:uncharacterized protein involved in cysteine biosynthesis